MVHVKDLSLLPMVGPSSLWDGACKRSLAAANGIHPLYGMVHVKDLSLLPMVGPSSLWDGACKRSLAVVYVE